MFPRVDSHYCRASTDRQYLAEELNIKKMHRLFIEWRKTLGENSSVKESFYREIFKTKFNLFFYRPKKDQCDLCTRYKFLAKDSPEEIAMRPLIIEHLDRSEQARKLMKIDKNVAITDKTVCAVSFDLQQAMDLPHSLVGIWHYKRKISLYNFTIYDLSTKEGFCHVWDETKGKRGSDEIGSCLLRFIKIKIAEGVNDFKFYSDNCSGQNKNQFLYSMLAKIAVDYQVKITQRYLVKGHTETAGDSIHSTIDRAIKNKEIFTEDQYCQIFRTCKTQTPYYEVHQMSQDEIFDLKPFSCQSFWAKMKILQISEIVFNRNKTIECKYSFDSEAKIYPAQYNDSNFTKSYSGKLKLDKEKKKDIETTLKNLDIPAIYHNYYKNLLN